MLTMCSNKLIKSMISMLSSADCFFDGFVAMFKLLHFMEYHLGFSSACILCFTHKYTCLVFCGIC